MSFLQNAMDWLEDKRHCHMTVECSFVCTGPNGFTITTGADNEPLRCSLDDDQDRRDDTELVKFENDFVTATMRRVDLVNQGQPYDPTSGDELLVEQDGYRYRYIVTTDGDSPRQRTNAMDHQTVYLQLILKEVTKV